jgi:cold-inducible RNA-binding protein
MAYRLYVGNLNYETTAEGLRAAFASYGAVAAEVIVDRNTGISKGFGFVEVAEAEMADAAIRQLNGSEMDGRTIRVSTAHPREGKRPSRDRQAHGDRRDW